MEKFIVKKVLNNNVLIAKEQGKETDIILVGKGIGFDLQGEVKFQKKELKIYS